MHTLGISWRSLEFILPLCNAKILILSANPKNTNRLRLDQEVRDIKTALKLSKNREKFEVVTEWAVRVNDLRRALLDNEPHIVHFSGHGLGSDGLALENELGQMQLVSSESLAGLFNLFKDQVQCVVLNACYSEVQAEAINQHIDCVIGMNQAIGDDAAIQFATGFYDGLMAGRNYQDSFGLGCGAIDLQGIPESKTPQIKLRTIDLRLPLIEKPPPPPKSSLTREELRFRKVLLNKVRKSWIENVLKKSLLDENNYISIHWQNRPDQVKQVANEIPYDEEPQSILDTEIKDVFVDMGAGRTLLILGKPGVGKTTILLKLLEGLIQQIETDLNQPIPVVFNLSSWNSQSKQNFAQWLVQELNRKYEVEKTLAEDWVKQQQLILVLDSLDEVQKKYRRDCIQKINEFRLSHGVNEIVICSRIEEYETISEKLKLDKAIYLQPLTLHQIQDYLDRAGEDLTYLKNLITENILLQELAETPMTLSLMVITYNNYSIRDLPNTNELNELRKHLFNTYIRKMFKRRLNSKKYQDDRQAKKWLIWLAGRMKDNQSIFKIEQIQPSWLVSEKYKKIYRIVVRLILGLLVGFIAGMYFIYRTYSDEMGKETISNILNSSYLSLIIGVLSGLIHGLLLGQVYIKNKHLITLMSGIIFATTSAILFKIINIDIHVSAIFVVGPICGSISRLIIREEIHPAEIIKPKLTQVIKSLLIWLGWGLLYVFLHWVTNPGLYEDRPYNLVYELLVFTTVCGVYRGFTTKRKKEINDKKTLPNQGIRRSINYTLILFIIFIPCAMLFVWVFESMRSPFYLICIGLTAGLLAGLAGNQGSGIISIQHFILRVFLWWKGDIPWNYARFLNYATERIFLRNMGGSYIFIHRMLLEHFAQMEPNQDNVPRVTEAEF